MTTTLPIRLAQWAITTVGGLLEAIVPANGMAECVKCGHPTWEGVQPCTPCMYTGINQDPAPSAVESPSDATPPAPFTHGDLSRSAAILRAWANDHYEPRSFYWLDINALADQLAAASEADPNP